MKIERSLLEWAVRNLERCFSKDELTRVCKLNIKDFPDAAWFFEDFVNEMNTMSNVEMHAKYKALLEQQAS